MNGIQVHHLIRRLGESLHHAPWILHSLHIPKKTPTFQRTTLLRPHIHSYRGHTALAACPAHSRYLQGYEGSTQTWNAGSVHYVFSCLRRHCLSQRHFHASGRKISQLGSGIGKSDSSATHLGSSEREIKAKNESSLSAWKIFFFSYLAIFPSEQALRLSNENNYLSWCRNTYLSTVVGIAMMGEGSSLLAQHAAEGAFFVAGINLTWGTGQLFFNLFYLRRRMEMSLIWALLYAAMGTLHLLLWLMVCLLYIGYTDDERKFIVIDKDSDGAQEG